MGSKTNYCVNLPKVVTGTIDESVGSTPIIVTHDGRFHCDDAIACGMLLCLPEYANAIVVRTRKQDLIDRGTVVVDVGGVYDPQTLRFDHHQRGFEGFFDAEWRKVTKLSSAGMVFKHFGARILTEQFKVPADWTPRVVKQIYENLIESVDAIDNGVNICPKGVEPLYMVRSDLSSRVARLNSEWNQWTDDYVAPIEFTKAIEIAMEEFGDSVRLTRDSWLPARILVEEAYKKRFETHPSGQVIELDQGCPFETVVCILSGFASGPFGGIRNGKVKAVKQSRMSFGNRLDLPARLAGLRDGTLAELGFPGVSFVHHAKFLAGCSSRDAAIDLADKTIAESSTVN